MRLQLRRPVIGLALVSTCALVLAGCRGGQGEDSGDEGTAPAEGAIDEDSASGENDVVDEGSFGTITIDGEVLEIVDVYCGQVPVEDNAWRVIAEFENGELTVNEGGGGSVVIDGERVWGVSSGDDTTRIDVGEHGATGETTVYHTDDTQDLAQLVADVSC